MMWVAARGCCELSIEMGGPLRLPPKPPSFMLRPTTVLPITPSTPSFTWRVTIELGDPCGFPQTPSFTLRPTTVLPITPSFMLRPTTATIELGDPFGLPKTPSFARGQSPFRKPSHLRCA